ncbi:MAG: DNA repair protein RecO [Flavobacteriaceae bacterium]
MQVTTKAIVLSSIKYGDSSLIVKAYTEKAGLQSYLLKGVLSSRKSKIKAAYFQPLTQLEIVASHKGRGTLEHIREVRANYHYHSIYSDMAKNAIAIFLAEILLKSIGEGEEDTGLFQFLEASFQWLDTHDLVSNFHLYFMIRLSKFLGFYPDISNSDTMYFDLQAGQFVDTPGLNPLLHGTTLYHFKSLLGIKFDALHTVKMAKKERQELLQNLVMYFELHLHGFQKPRSLAILNEVFN